MVSVDQSMQTSAPFVKLVGDECRQIIKFKPGESISFSVRLPNGDLLETVESDTASPLLPNPFCQICTLFEVRQI